MINLLKMRSRGKKVALSTCLLAFLAANLAPLAHAQSYTSGVQENAENYSYSNTTSESNSELRRVMLKGAVSLEKGNQKVAVSLRDSDVKQVLRMFADKAGLNIVFHESVNGKITLDLVNTTLNDAFSMVMEMAELTYTIENDTVMVAASEQAKKLNFTKGNMTPVPVKYINANKAAIFLNKNIFTKSRPGLSNSEVAIANPRENEILIFGSKTDWEVASKVIAEIDKPLKMTTFKVNHTTPKEMATLICDTYLPDKGTEGDELEDNSDEDIVIGGGVIACSVDSEDEDHGEMVSLESQGMKVAYFPGHSTVKLYGGTAEQVENMRKFIEDSDRKRPQALLEMSIVELNETGSKTFSNNWQIYSRFFTGTIGGSGIYNNDEIRPMIWRSPSDQFTFVDWKTGEPSKGFYKWRGTPIISSTINWLISNRNGRVLSTPKVMITNGQKSVIDLTSDYVKSVTTQFSNNTYNSYVTRTYEIASDNGIKIELTPFISPDGYVSMNIVPKYSTIKDQIMVDGVIATTLLQKREIDLKGIRVKDGETLVIGGLMQEAETKSADKPPLLGDIPILGWFFRSSGSSKEKSELILMITPHIIQDTEDLMKVNETEAL